MKEKIEILFIPQLKHFIKRDNISQNQLAKEIGVESSTVSKWITGRSEPTIENLWRLADYFEISVDTLIGRD